MSKMSYLFRIDLIIRVTKYYVIEYIIADINELKVSCQAYICMSDYKKKLEDFEIFLPVYKQLPTFCKTLQKKIQRNNKIMQYKQCKEMETTPLQEKTLLHPKQHFGILTYRAIKVMKHWVKHGLVCYSQHLYGNVGLSVILHFVFSSHESQRNAPEKCEFIHRVA